MHYVKKSITYEMDRVHGSKLLPDGTQRVIVNYNGKDIVEINFIGTPKYGESEDEREYVVRCREHQKKLSSIKTDSKNRIEIAKMLEKIACESNLI